MKNSLASSKQLKQQQKQKKKRRRRIKRLASTDGAGRQWCQPHRERTWDEWGLLRAWSSSPRSKWPVIINSWVRVGMAPLLRSQGPKRPPTSLPSFSMVTHISVCFYLWNTLPDTTKSWSWAQQQPRKENHSHGPWLHQLGPSLGPTNCTFMRIRIYWPARTENILFCFV